MPYNPVAQGATGPCFGTCYFDVWALITTILLILSASSLAADAIFMTDPALQNRVSF